METIENWVNANKEKLKTLPQKVKKINNHLNPIR